MTAGQRARWVNPPAGSPRTGIHRFRAATTHDTYMGRFEYEDTLEILGVLGGLFLIIVALGTLSGLPWTTNDDGLAVVIQLVGIVVLFGLGVVLVLMTYTGDIRDLRPGNDDED